MSVAIITGSACLVGSETARHFARLSLDVAGVDNDMRAYFFGPDGTTKSTARKLIIGPTWSTESV